MFGIGSGCSAVLPQVASPSSQLSPSVWPRTLRLLALKDTACHETPKYAFCSLRAQHSSTAECLQLFLDRRLMCESESFAGSAPRGTLPMGRETSWAVSLFSGEEFSEMAITAL